MQHYHQVVAHLQHSVITQITSRHWEIVLDRKKLVMLKIPGWNFCGEGYLENSILATENCRVQSSIKRIDNSQICNFPTAALPAPT